MLTNAIGFCFRTAKSISSLATCVILSQNLVYQKLARMSVDSTNRPCGLHMPQQLEFAHLCRLKHTINVIKILYEFPLLNILLTPPRNIRMNFKVTQSHQRWCHLKQHTALPISNYDSHVSILHCFKYTTSCSEIVYMIAHDPEQSLNLEK